MSGMLNPGCLSSQSPSFSGLYCCSSAAALNFWPDIEILHSPQFKQTMEFPSLLFMLVHLCNSSEIGSDYWSSFQFTQNSTSQVRPMCLRISYGVISPHLRQLALFDSLVWFPSRLMLAWGSFVLNTKVTCMVFSTGASVVNCPFKVGS